MFTALFDSLAIPDPLDITRMVITNLNCAEFIAVVTSQKANPTDDRIPKIMKYGKPDANGENKIDKDDFIAFYKEKAYSNIGTVRDNIGKFGYSNDLRKLADNKDPDNILQHRKTAEDMPRYKLSNTEEYFKILLDLTTLHPEIKNRAKGLFESCCTRQELYKSIQNIGLESKFSWSEVPEYDFMKIYTLDIISNIII